MLALRILSRLPFWILYALADFTSFVGFYILRYRRKVVWTNLVKSFPNRDEHELWHIQKKFYISLCEYAAETLKLLSITREELGKRIVFRNPEVVKNFTSRNQSVVLYASHLFNWEWILAAGTFSLGSNIDFVYQAQHSDVFNRFLLACRTRFGAYPIQREKVARELAKRREEVRAIAIVADQFPGLSTDKRYWTKFLNQETAFFQSVNQLAILTQYPTFFANVIKIERGHYEVELIELSVPPYDKENFRVVEKYTRVTEEAISRQPENWLWSHKRWKRARLSGE